MSPATSQLSIVITLPHLSFPFCLHCLGSSFQSFGSSLDPTAKHRGATGHPASPPPYPTLTSPLSDVSLLLSQRCFCLIFFQLKKVVRKVSSKKGTPMLVSSRALHAMAHIHPPHPLPSLSAYKYSISIPNLSRFEFFSRFLAGV
jgi:hypothetical protein